METDKEIPGVHGKLLGQQETLLKEDKVKATETDTNINLWLPWVLMHVHMCACMYTHTCTHVHTCTQAPNPRENPSSFSGSLTELQWVQHPT